MPRESFPWRRRCGSVVDIQPLSDGWSALDALVSLLSLTKGWVYHELSLLLDYHDLPCHEDYDGFTVVVTATSSHVPVTAGSRFSVRPGVATVPQIDADAR